MVNLDNQEGIEKYDKGKILASIRMLPEQIEQSWEEIKTLPTKNNFNLSKNVVICGMGGSALGGRIVDSLLNDLVRIPIEISTDYEIPNYVNKNCLLIITSYSGNTEETISALRSAIDRGAKIFIISTGGKMAEILKDKKLDGYIYEARANPSGQPRMALGYSIGSTLTILSKCGFLKIDDSDIYSLATTIRKFIRDFDIDSEEKINIAKSYAQKLINKVPVLVTSEHLLGVAHAFKNQLNENSKTFSVLFDLPELNHHLLEGLQYPKKIRELLHFIFINSKQFNKRTIKRYKITQEVIEKNGFNFDEYSLNSRKKLDQIFELLTLSSYTSFYLAYLNNVDPSEIPWVDYFKKKLGDK